MERPRVGRRWSTLLAASAVLAFPTSSHAAAPAPSCFPKGAKTLAATKTARVFKTRRGTFGCLYKYGRARRLDPASARADTQTVVVKPFRFGGPYLAYPREVTQGCGVDACVWTEIVVADLRPTKPLVVQSQYSMSDENVPVGGGEYNDAFVTSLVLRPSGVVAWIECDGDVYGGCDPTQADHTSVFAASPRKRARTKLDEGKGIDKGSLRWANGMFRWVDNGQPRAAAYG